MTVEVETSRVTYTGSGTTGPFTIPFYFLRDEDIRAFKVLIADGTETELALSTDFTLTGEGDEDGGELTLTSTLSSSYQITIFRDPELLQEIDYPRTDPFPSESHERGLDLAMMIDQRTRDMVERTMRLSDGAIVGDFSLSLPTPEAGAYVRANAAGTGLEWVSEVDPAEESATFLQSGSGAVTRTWTAKVGERISVKDFGAVGDGVTDDTAAIQAAIDHARSLRNAEVYFPPNASATWYRTTSELTVDGPIKLYGDGPNAAQIIADGLSAGEYVLNIDCDPLDVVQHIEVSGLTLRGDGTPNGIRIKDASISILRHVRCYGVENGIVLTGTACYSMLFEQVETYDIGVTGVKLISLVGGQYRFDTCNFAGDTYGVWITSTAEINNLSFDTCNWETCGTDMLVEGNVQGLSLVAPRTEASQTAGMVFYTSAGKEIEGLSITGGFFNPNSASIYPISLGGGGGSVRGFNISGCVANVTTAALVQHNGGGDNGTIHGNFINTATGGVVSGQRATVAVFNNANTSGALTEYVGTESTFTFTDGSGAALSLTEGRGHYTRIGRQVFWQAVVIYPATADGSNAVLTGLPFSALAGAGLQGRAGVNVSASTEAAMGAWHVGITVTLKNCDTLANKTNADLSGDTIYLSGSYAV